jgi:hypothetical protein
MLFIVNQLDFQIQTCHAKLVNHLLDNEVRLLPHNAEAAESPGLLKSCCAVNVAEVRCQVVWQSE